MGPYQHEDKEEPAIEMVHLLEQERADKSVSQESLNEPWGDRIIENIEWQGEMIKVYPLDYQRVRIVKMQIAACLIMFIVFGLNDQTTGSLIPTLTKHYGISKVTVSNIFLVQVLGYTIACLLNETLHIKFGMRGAMSFAAVLFIIFFGLLALKPPSFFLYAACYLPVGLSIGILDSTGNVLLGNLVSHKNEWMGILHGLYGAASMITPPIISYFVEWDRWPSFFYIPLGCSIFGFMLLVPAFRFETAAKYNYMCNVHEDQSDIPEGEETSDGKSSGFINLLKKPAILLYAMYLFIYLGAEVSTGSWLFTYLLSTKSDNTIAMSYVTSSFWTGLTVGRLGLGFVTKRLFTNEYHASHTYGLLALLFYTIFVFVGLFNTDNMWYIGLVFFVVFLCGIFIGPLFPNASIVALQVLPKKLHVGGMGVAVALGGCGNAMLPYLVGVILHFTGMNWFPMLCWTMVAGFTVIWRLYPKYIKGCDEFL